MLFRGRGPVTLSLVALAALPAACGGRDGLWLQESGGAGSAGGGAGGLGGNAGRAGSGGATAGSGGNSCPDCDSIEAGECSRYVCDPASRTCLLTSMPDGTGCDDGDFCTVGESCLSGVCAGGEPNTCGVAVGPCHLFTCDAAARTCAVSQLADGMSCEPEGLCEINGVCSGGACIGTPKDCTGVLLPNECYEPLCLPETGQCVAAATTGGLCVNTADPCSVNGTCDEGVCAGVPKDCSSLDEGCTVGVCDSGTGACLAAAAPDGTACDDDDPCSNDDQCSSGECSPGAPVTACSDGDSCCPLGCAAMGDDDCPPSEIVLAAVNRGWWENTGLHNAGNDNTFTGFYDGHTYNSYFSFDLSGLSATIVTATLVLEQQEYYGPHSSETLSVWDVTTAAATVEASSASNTAVFQDLQSGVQFAAFSVAQAQTGQLHSVQLNAQAIAALNAAAGTTFSFGVRVDTLTAMPETEGVRFSASNEARVHELVLGIE